ncbi:MAG: ABC transporter permease [Candidatus Eisenbacteria bacterium]|nr:ABC transporter permease [Candidatus Eisenbacteria bacterium]
MQVLENILIALSSLWVHKMRSFLTTLGVVIGVGAVITMVSLGQGARRAVQERILALGSNLVFVRPGSFRMGHVAAQEGARIDLTDKDAKAIKKDCPAALVVVPELQRSEQVKYGNKNWNTRVIGTTPDFGPVRNFKPTLGRFFTWQEDLGMARVCLLGETVRENLFGQMEDPVGETIRIGRVNFTVIGLLPEKGQTGFSNQDDQVVVPLNTAQKRLFGIDYLSGISVQARDAKSVDQTVLEIEKALRKSHRIKTGGDNDFTIRVQTDVLTTMEETSKTLGFLLAGVAGVSLIVGGIGIMNIMLVSVRERTREIGTRKAIGARRRDILFQFLVEAVTLSLVGGTVGILLGVLASYLLSAMARWNTSISLSSIIVSFLFAAAVGIFFGLYPARKASLLNPTEALRYE